MEKRKFRWRYLVMSLPIAFFFSFVDQGGTFYPSQIHVAGILLIVILMGIKKKEGMFILGNAFSTMLFVFGMINIYALPGTNTTNLLVISPFRLLPAFSLVLLAYAIFTVLRIVYKVKKDDNLSMDEKNKHKFNFMLISVSYFVNLGLYVLINTLIRAVYTFNNGLSSEETNLWGNWHYQNDILMFVGLVFIAMAFVSIPMMKGILKHKNKLAGP